MSEYNMKIIGDINLSDYSNIYDYLSIVGDNDKFTITIENDNSDNLEVICKLLQDNNFIVSSQVGHDNSKYDIVSVRKK